MDTFSNTDIRELLLCDNSQARAMFVEQFDLDLNSFAVSMVNVFLQLQTMKKQVRDDLRSEWTYEFLYAAFNSIFSAWHLLFSGYLIPSGNLMRHFGEAIAMALLCSHRAIDILDRVQREEARFPVHDALRMVNRKRNRRLLSVNKDGWNRFDEVTRFFDTHSHSSIGAVSSLRIYSAGGRQLGGEYDPGKLGAYKKTVSLMNTATTVLRDTIVVSLQHLNKSTPSDG